MCIIFRIDETFINVSIFVLTTKIGFLLSYNMPNIGIDYYDQQYKGKMSK